MSNKYYKSCNISSGCPSFNSYNNNSLEMITNCSNCPTCGCCGLFPPQYIPEAYFPIYNSDYNNDMKYSEISSNTSPSNEPGDDIRIKIKKNYDDYQQDHIIEMEKMIGNMKLSKEYKSYLENKLGPAKSLKQEEEDLYYNKTKAIMGLEGIRVSGSDNYISSAPSIDMTMYNMFYGHQNRNCPGTFKI